MAENEGQTESQKKQSERKFSQEQYEMLLHCSQKRDIAEWNQWRKEHPGEEILLEKANLEGAHLEYADLSFAHLENANLRKAHLENSILWEAKLQGANLMETKLQGAKFMRAHLQRVEFGGAELQGADFSRAIVDGETLIWRCKFDMKTKFEGVALGNMRIYPKEKQLFEYNIRRMNWEDWYKGKSEKKWVVGLHQLLTSPVRLFWSISDYGLRTWRIILWFSGLAIVFAFAYFLRPNCIMVNGSVGEIRGFVHALYFSVVTMTTLGFGDIAANPDSWQGQVLLMVQVILGYVLLGALVTRFAVLFTSGGPAGKFAKEEKLKNQNVNSKITNQNSK